MGSRILMLTAFVALSCAKPHTQSPQEVATAAFVWGYPLVVTQRTMQTFESLLGPNTLFSQTAIAGTSVTYIVSPNQDTLYSVAVVDLREGPMVLTVPDVTDRYWSFAFIDAWTNAFHYIGTRATGGQGGQFVITGPGWSGSLPAEVTQVTTPTPVIFLLGRYQVRGEADVPNVVAIQRTLAPLSVSQSMAPSLGMPPGTPQQVGTDGTNFFDELGDALAADAPDSAADKAALASYASLGVGPGKHPMAAAMAENDTSQLQLLQAAIPAGMAQILAASTDPADDHNGWTVFLDIGTYADPLRRAMASNIVWGANIPVEAIYGFATEGSDGQPLSGDHAYLVHFPAGQLPPVGAFWSITLYGPDRFFVANSLGRFAIGTNTPGIETNADGSLDVVIQSAQPEAGASNWLPAPTGSFQLILRGYLPEPPLLQDTYSYPSIQTLSTPQ